MNVDVIKQDSKILATIDGRIDTVTAKEFEAVVKELLAEEFAEIEVDCEKLSYVSSSGLRVFLLLQKGVNAKNGKLVLKSMSDHIKEVFKITGFASIINIV